MLSYPQLAAIRLGYGLSPLVDPPADLGDGDSVTTAAE